jgi:hypothetical protein
MSGGRAARLAGTAWVAVPLLCGGLVWAPIVGNYFFADDFLNLYRIANLPLLEYVLTPHGGHVLLVRNALFALFRAVFGLRAELYFAAVLATHLLNVGLLFAAARALTGSGRVACVVATLWAVAPLHQGTLGWYSVYGQVVSATALLAILAHAARLRAAARVPSRTALAGWYALALIGATSFGVGLGAALALPPALALLRAEPVGARRLPPLWALWLAVPALYVATHVSYTAVTGDPPPGLRELAAAFGAAADGAPRTGGTRVVSVLTGLAASAAMLLEMLAYACAGLLGAWEPVARAGPMLWGTALVAVAVAAIAAGRSDPSVRRPLLAMGTLVLGCYASVALGRGAALQALGVAHAGLADRYHYVATAPLALVVGVALSGLRRVLPLGRAAGTAALAGWLLWLLGSYLAGAPRIEHHDASRMATEQVLAEIARLRDRAPAGEPAYVASRGFAPIANVLSPLDFPGWAALYIAFEPRARGAAPRFVEPRAALVRAARRGRRSRKLVIATDQVPAGRAVLQPDPVDAELTEAPFGFPP